jgi:hypothetical protein
MPTFCPCPTQIQQSFERKIEFSDSSYASKFCKRHFISEKEKSDKYHYETL